MALTPKRAAASCNAGADAIVALADGGKLKIYDGTILATADTAIGSQTLLVELTLANPASAGSASAGVVTFDTITSGTAVATGTASWFLVTDSSDNPLFVGSVGTSGCNVNLSSTSIVSGGTVAVSSFTYTETPS